MAAQGNGKSRVDMSPRESNEHSSPAMLGAVRSRFANSMEKIMFRF